MSICFMMMCKAQEKSPAGFQNCAVECILFMRETRRDLRLTSRLKDNASGRATAHQHCNEFKLCVHVLRAEF